MKRFVLDCSISASWCLTDEQNGEALDILERLTKEEAVVPYANPRRLVRNAG